MKFTQDFDREFRREFADIIPNLIWQNDNGEFEVFGKYRIVPERPGFRVYCSANSIGVFNSSKSALSWCIADKHARYNLARELLEVDNKLGTLTQDIQTRATLGERSKSPEFRETVVAKLESKIIHKKQLENQLAKCVSWAKYCQQRGFNNETQRTSRITTNKTNR